MFIGICPFCDYYCIGFELIDVQSLKCPDCGIGRLIAKDNYEPPEGDPSFVAGSFDVNPFNEPPTKDDTSLM
jgi:hypothetical protein